MTAPTTPAESLCLIAALCAGAAWLTVALARSARVDRRTQRDETAAQKRNKAGQG